ncbi:MAG: hypothetical protein HY553_22295 [Elusimicrobia bacterium]|nr:hypothetical protein [Elusimicrobiota bacterium]
MSAICVFTPMVVELAWPALAAALTASLTAAGYRAHSTRERNGSKERVSKEHVPERTLEFDSVHGEGLAEGMGEEEQLVFQKDGLALNLRRAPDGRLRVCVTGPGRSDAELEAAGRAAMNAFLQDYVRQRVTAELKKRGYSLEEERLPDGTVRLKARKRE